jgi:catechol 2,3-dioxygenase-like lactoylglutathione lyase family enzyme
VIVATYPIVVTDKLHECRDFYTRWFRLSVVFEASWIVVLGSDGGAPVVAFVHPHHPSTPPEPGPFSGDGMFLTLQVEDAAAEYSRLREAGLECVLELTDEPWGQRRFATIDPAECGSTWWSRRSLPKAGGTSTFDRPTGRRPHRRAATLVRRAPVAQLDRASVYGTEGLRFES